MSERPTYPRINCCIPGCKRGTTTHPPGRSIICGKCWRKAPKAMRDQYSRWRRKGDRLEKKGDPRAEIAFVRMARTFWAIRRVLVDPPPPYEMSPLMAEELRAAGLL